MSAWKEIWEQRGSNYPLSDGLKLNGFDQSFGQISTQAFEEMIIGFSKKLCLDKTSTLLEVGCGSGVFINKLSSYAGRSIGMDLSESMIERAKSLYPGIELFSGDPRNLPLDSLSVDRIFCHSVFQYFDDYTYADSVLKEMSRILKPDGIILISDIMDIDKKDAYLKMRQQASSDTIWKSSINSEVSHLYYSKSFFTAFALRNDLICTLEDRNVSEYKNSIYRFDVKFQNA